MEKKFDSSDNLMPENNETSSLVASNVNQEPSHVEKRANDSPTNESNNKNDVMYNIEQQIARIVGEEEPDDQQNLEVITKNTNQQDSKNDLVDLESNNINESEDNQSLKEELPSEQDSNMVVQHDSTVKRENVIVQEEIDDLELIEEDTQNNKMDPKNSDQSDSSVIISETSNCAVFTIDEDSTSSMKVENDMEEQPSSTNLQNDTKADSESNQQYDISELVSIKEVKNLRRCFICQYTTPHLNILRKHVTTTHMGVACKHCHRRFASKNKLAIHTQKKHSTKIQKCPYCNYKSFYAGQDMSKHIMRAHTRSRANENRCKYCQKKFSSKALAENHIRMEHAKRIRKCHICSYQAYCKEKPMKRHIENMHSNILFKNRYLCPYCKVPFESNISLNRHVHRKHSKKVHACPHCCYKINGCKKVMHKHINKVHKTAALDTNNLQIENEQRYKCKHCPYHDKNMEALKCHTKMHNLKYVLKCRLCHYMIDNVKLYGIHLEKNHRISKENFVCHKCFYETNSSVEYHSHFEKPHEFHICKTCDYETPFVEIFYDHMALHEDNRDEKFACYDCGYLAGSDSNLKRHLIEHKNIIENDVNVESDGSSCSSDNYREACYNDQEEAYNYQEKYHEEVNRNIKRYEEKIDIIKHYTVYQEDGTFLYACHYCKFKTIQNANIVTHIIKNHSMELESKKDSKDVDEKKNTDENVINLVSLNVHDNQSNLNQVKEAHNSQRSLEESEETMTYTELISPIKEKSFSCETCEFSSDTFKSLIVHKEQTHNITNFKCPGCCLEMGCGVDLITHLETYPDHTPLILTCPFCHISINDKTEMKNHVDSKHLDILQKGLKRSMLDEKPDTSNSQCTEATESSKLMNDDVYEIKETDSAQTYSYKGCQLTASDCESMNLHVDSDHVSKFLRCPRCSKNMSTDLKRFWEHLNEHCPQCRFRSDDSDKLKTHVLSHVAIYKDGNFRNHPNSNSFTTTPLMNTEEEVKQSTYNLEKELHKNETTKENRNLYLDTPISNLYHNLNEIPPDEPNEEIHIIFDDSDDDDKSQLLNFNNFPIKVESDDHVETPDREEANEEIKIEFIDSTSDTELQENEEPSGLYEDEDIFQFQEEISYKKEYGTSSNGHLRKIHRAKKLEEDAEIYEDQIEIPYIKKGRDIVKNEEEEKFDCKPMRVRRLVEYQCFDCLHIYKNRCTLVDHRKRMHGLKKSHSCTYCIEAFKSYSYLKSHYYRVHKVSYHNKGPVFRCTRCDFSSPFLKRMMVHCINSHNRYLKGYEK